jgi:copper chaperone CopZ
MAHLHRQHSSVSGRLRLPVTNLYCVCCAEELEARLRAEPHITRARVDFHSKTIDVGYHATMIDEAGIRALIDESGRCTCAGGRQSG